MKHLTEEQRLTVEMVRDVANREIAPRAQELDEKSLFPYHARDLFAQLGLLNPLLPAAATRPAPARGCSSCPIRAAPAAPPSLRRR